MNKEKLDLELGLPDDAHACDACVGRMLTSLRTTPGVEDAHIDSSVADKPKLCLHYDPNVVPVEQLRALVRKAGATLKERFAHLSVRVSGLRHERQARLVEGILAKQPGIIQVTIAFGTRRIQLEFDPSITFRGALLAAIAGAGVNVAGEAPVRGHKGHTHDHGEHQHEDARAHEKEADEHGHEHSGPLGEHSEFVFSLACGALTGLGWAASRTGASHTVSTTLYVIAYALGSWFTLKEVALALRSKKFEIDFLMLVAALGAAALGEWFEGALLLFLFTLGHALEGFAMGRARRAIEALAQLVPATAIRLEGTDVEKEVALAELAVGDRVRVKPNTRVPADGFVLSGTSSVDQAPITGESVPADKRPVPDSQLAAAAPESLANEHRVFAGTINGPSALTISVTKEAADSTLARVVKLVSEAETQKSPTQQFTDRFERVFVPVILVFVGLLLFAWVVVDESFTRSFYRAMAVLVAASPCALAIATPSAVLSGVARAARGGVLVKGGAHLEALGFVKAIAFDKTGTLTEGKPRLTDVVAMQGTQEAELLRIAWAVERQSDHPLARAVVGGAAERLGGSPTDIRAERVEAIVGFGVRATIDGTDVVIGKPGLFTREGALSEAVSSASEKLQAEGRTVMVAKFGERFLGVLGVMDTPRASAHDVIAALHGLGVEKTVMLTGDNQRVADAVAKEVGLRVARGDLLPEQKVSYVAELARGGEKVAMVGDGVNDAPAMASATVGVAMGAGGSDVALETADVALMADDLRALPFAVGLSRAARTIIQQNLWVSLGMVAFLVPATVLGFARIGLAVALHEGSTLLVVINALRLLAYELPEPKHSLGRSS